MTVDNRGTDNGSICVKSGKNVSGRKRLTMAIRLSFFIKNVFVNYLFRSYIRICIQILIFPDTELGAPVIQSGTRTHLTNLIESSYLDSKVSVWILQPMNITLGKTFGGVPHLKFI